jgi:hypothetical protein
MMKLNIRKFSQRKTNSHKGSIDSTRFDFSAFVCKIQWELPLTAICWPIAAGIVPSKRAHHQILNFKF